MSRKALNVALVNKKDQQVLNDTNLSPAERWLYMWKLIELSISLSPPGRTLKDFPPNDRFVTLTRKNVSA